MQHLHIRYENGQMTLNVPAFFPCTLPDARKVFPLINRYCAQEEKEELHDYLYELEHECGERCKSLAAAAAGYTPYSKQCRELTAEFKRIQTKLKRTKRNLEMLDTGKEEK